MPPAPTVATNLQRSSTIPLVRGRDSIATSAFDGLWTSGRQTGSYPETGFEEIGALDGSQQHHVSSKPTSGQRRRGPR
jgi:hypothetical protein